jgi:acetyl-CoA carboxylase carboxyltransferase component
MSDMADRTEHTIPSPASNVIPTRIDGTSARFEKNMRAMADLVSTVHNEEEKIREGGGAKAIEAQHKKGRLTARERIALLLDPGTDFFELGAYAAFGMYEEWGGAPAAGVVTGLGRIHDRLFMLIVNDATVKAGAFFPMTSKKVIRAQNIAIDNRIPTIYLVDSAGIFLPLQEDVFPDTDDFGRVFRNNSVMTAMGIPQIAAIMGMCVAGGGYLPVMCDNVLMTDGSGLFLAGPALVQAAIGAKYTADELGGAAMHSAISGTIDYHEPNDEACITRIRSLVDKMGYRRQSPYDRRKPVPPAYAAEEIYGIYESDPARPYDMKEIIAATRALAALPWASSPTRSSTSNRLTSTGTSASSSAASSTPSRRRRPRASSWTATRTWCRWFFCTTSTASWWGETPNGAGSSRRARRW